MERCFEIDFAQRFGALMSIKAFAKIGKHPMPMHPSLETMPWAV